QLTKSLAFMTLMRTTYGNPHYINDVMENYYRYVGETNRSYVTNGMGANSFTRRIVAPSGTEEPMYYYMGTHMGSSDHEVFNDWGVGVPGVIMNTWPDIWYHTTQDRIDKMDPTQMKRVVVIGAAAAYSIANADDEMAMQIAAEIVSNSSQRIGHQLARGLEELKRADAETFAGSYKKVRGYIEASSINERATAASVMELAENRRRVGRFVDTLQESVSGIEASQLKVLDSFMEARARQLQVEPVSLALTDLEQKASRIVPRPTDKITRDGYRGYQKYIQEAQREITRPISGGRLRNATEVQLLIDGVNSALDIKKLCDTQFQQETDLQSILNHLEILQKAGLIEI
ncbi:MAG: M28 family peptidase, partial [Planctomycetes bacterium]|nr:M28 family peptidase [Planctomycetota bacterium]